MKIANAAYDVVFRYLMMDNKVAKIMLSALIEEEIIELEFKSTDVPIKIGELPQILMMDFAATIRTIEGKEKEVIIELQKTRYYLEVMRFRNYLGKQYSSNHNVVSETKDGVQQGRPILPIFILGDKLTKQEIPVIRVNRSIIDVATKEKIEHILPFIEALTHDGIFVQLPYVKKHRRTDLEKLLAVFDGDGNRKQFLDIKEEEIPEKYREVLRRLKKAIQKPEITDIMNSEDAYLDVFARARLELEFAKKEAEEAKKEAKLKVEEATKVKQQLNSTICNMKKSGFSVEQIAELTGNTVAFVEEVDC